MGCGRCCHDTPRGSTAVRARSAPCGPRVSAKDAAIAWVPSVAQSPFTPLHHKPAEVRVLVLDPGRAPTGKVPRPSLAVPSCITSPGWRGKGLECADSESNREPTD